MASMNLEFINKTTGKSVMETVSVPNTKQDCKRFGDFINKHYPEFDEVKYVVNEGITSDLCDWTTYAIRDIKTGVTRRETVLDD
jgi:hypothetical protein